MASVKFNVTVQSDVSVCLLTLQETAVTEVELVICSLNLRAHGDRILVLCNVLEFTIINIVHVA